MRLIHGFVGDSAEDPAVLAARGVPPPRFPRRSRFHGQHLLRKPAGTSRGADVFRTSHTYVLPSGWNAVTSDGKFFVTWDNSLYGVDAVDLEKKEDNRALHQDSRLRSVHVDEVECADCTASARTPGTAARHDR